MNVVPKEILARIQFCEEHVTPWQSNAVAMGSSATAVTDWSAKVTAARAAYSAQKAAQIAARDATNDLKLALQAMNDATASIIKQVRAKADLVGDSVYSLASIPAPALPAPVGEPGKPTEMTVELDESGALHLGWKCANPRGSSGTIYQVWRRLGTSGEFTYVGGCGAKKFVDSAVPAGTASITYQIQAVRSTAVGPWAQFNVNFGAPAGGGTMTASVVEGTPSKIAA